jgi:hypothetical protein
LKAVSDHTIIRGLTDISQPVVDLLTKEYLYSTNMVHRALTIKSLCKIVLSQKNDSSMERTQNILCQLMIQWFDPNYSWAKESEVKQYLTCFFRNLVLVHKQRCANVMEGLKRMMFVMLESKFGHKIEEARDQVKKGPGKTKRKVSEDDESFNSAAGDDYDSEFEGYEQLTLKQICKDFTTNEILQPIKNISLLLGPVHRA